METRQRKLNRGMNSYSREFFSMIFESIYSERASHYTFRMNVVIPEIYVFMPTNSTTTKDMLRFKMSNIVYNRKAEFDEQNLQNENLGTDQRQTESDGSYLSVFNIASVSLSLANLYNSMVNDIEVTKQEGKQNIFRTEKIKMLLESKIIETKADATLLKRRGSENLQKMLGEKVFRSKEFRVKSNLPPIEANLDGRALTVLLQLYDLWIVNVPFLLHPYLEVSQFERVSELMSDPIFQKFDFSGHLLQNLLNHKLLTYDLKIEQLAIRFNIGNRNLSLLIEDLRLFSTYAFFFTNHKISNSNVVLFDETNSSTLVKFDHRPLKKGKQSDDLVIELNFNNPYLLGAFKRYQDAMRNEVASWEYPIDISVITFARLFVVFDPTVILNFQKESLARYAQSKQDNLNEIREQIQRGNRIRKLVETDFKGTSSYHDSRLQEVIFANRTEFMKAQEEQLVKIMLNFAGGAALHLNFETKPLYLVFTPLLTVKLHLDTNYLVHCFVKAVDSKAIDISGFGLKEHPIIAEPNKPSRSVSSSIKLVFMQLNEATAKAKKFSSYLGVKAKNMKLVVLKRRIQELVEYARKYLLYLFIYERDHLIRSQTYFESLPKHSTIFIEVVLQNSILIIPRSTLSSEGLVLSCNKIALWSIGAWGASCGDLTKTGEFDSEFIVEKKEFFDVLEEDQKEDLKNLYHMLNQEAANQRSSSSGSKSTGIYHRCNDAFRVYLSRMKGMLLTNVYHNTYYTKQEIDANSVIEIDKYSTLHINFNATSMLEQIRSMIPIEGTPC